MKIKFNHGIYGSSVTFEENGKIEKLIQIPEGEESCYELFKMMKEIPGKEVEFEETEEKVEDYHA